MLTKWGPQQKRILIVKGDRTTHRADISQPLPASPAIAQWAREHMAMVAGIEVVHRLSNVDCYSPRSLGYSHC